MVLQGGEDGLLLAGEERAGIDHCSVCEPVHVALEHVPLARRAGRPPAARDFSPCRGSTHRTYRNGLLPDRMGRDELEPPRAGDDALLAKAVSGPTFTLPIRRRWELDDAS